MAAGAPDAQAPRERINPRNVREVVANEEGVVGGDGPPQVREWSLVVRRAKRALDEGPFARERQQFFAAGLSALRREQQGGQSTCEQLSTRQHHRSIIPACAGPWGRTRARPAGAPAGAHRSIRLQSPPCAPPRP